MFDDLDGVWSALGCRFTWFGSIGGVHEAVEALNNASGYMRKELGRRVKLRVIPYLKFFYDESIERGANMASLIEQARQSDKPS